MKLAVSWSGGKDSCFACHKAIQQGNEVVRLLVMMSNRGRSNFHAISQELLDAQSSAIGIPIVKWNTTPETYEQEFKNALAKMKAEGVEALVTGDIYEVALHEPGWLERVCGEVGLETVKPLWHRDSKEILVEFMNEGFEATVVRTKTGVLNTDWLGRQLNREFYDDLVKLGTVDLCGERGEYHTFVTDGPLFKKRIEILKTSKTTIDGWGLLEIREFILKPKRMVT